MEELEKLYIQAKDAYYNGSPIMSDSEFDELECKLKENGSNVTTIVGAWDRKAKIKHPSPMRSLEKIQADKTTGEAPSDEFLKWIHSAMDKCGATKIEALVGQKLDGNAVNLVYVDGQLKHALSRGDGSLGRDYITKIDRTQVPSIIPVNGTVEIRCEAVIPKDIFAMKYADEFSNERNYVAGVLNSDEYTEEQRKEISLVPVEYHEVTGNGNVIYHDIKEIEDWGFFHYDDLFHTYVTFTHDDTQVTSLFKVLFDCYENFKHEQSKYRVDGMVIKLMANNREYMGEVEHHPLWAIAVKFKPEDCVTEVIGFEMNMGKTGTFTPVALLKPVDLDGSVVSKASAYNYSFIEENRLNVGSIVSLVKSGDIIPQIVNVVAPSSEPFDILGHFKCPYCGSELVIVNGKHIQCPNDECLGKRLQKFINGMSALKLYGIGPAMMEELYGCVEYDLPEYYLTNSVSAIKKELSANELTSKVWDNFVEELSNLKEITIEQVIALKSYDGISNDGKTITEIGKKLSGCQYSFTGLEKSVVSGWDEGGRKYSEIMDLVKSIEANGRKVVFHNNNAMSGTTLKVTLTGSPKEYGYKTKAEYVAFLTSKGYNVSEVPIKECDVLVTDDLDSDTSKMQNAKKLGKKIVTYETTDF